MEINRNDSSFRNLEGTNNMPINNTSDSFEDKSLEAKINGLMKLINPDDPDAGKMTISFNKDTGKTPLRDVRHIIGNLVDNSPDLKAKLDSHEQKLLQSGTWNALSRLKDGVASDDKIFVDAKTIDQSLDKKTQKVLKVYHDILNKLSKTQPK